VMVDADLERLSTADEGACHRADASLAASGAGVVEGRIRVWRVSVGRSRRWQERPERGFIPFVWKSPTTVHQIRARALPDGIVHLARSPRCGRHSRTRASPDGERRRDRPAGREGGCPSRERSSRPGLAPGSTAEVYGAGGGVARLETDALLPQSPYAASKVGAEWPCSSLGASWVRSVIARASPIPVRPSPRYVVPAFVGALRLPSFGDRTVPYRKPDAGEGPARRPDVVGPIECFWRRESRRGVQRRPRRGCRPVRGLPPLGGDGWGTGRTEGPIPRSIGGGHCPPGRRRDQASARHGWAPNISLEQTLRDW